MTNNDIVQKLSMLERACSGELLFRWVKRRLWWHACCFEMIEGLVWVGQRLFECLK